MAKIDLEKVLIALLDSPFNKQFDDKVKDALKEQGLEYKDGEIVESQKPKFKVGDWITTTDDEGNIAIEKIIEFWGDKVRLIDTDGVFVMEPKYELKNYHLWTIQDAKDGDVLIRNEGIKSICIFSHFDGISDKYESFTCYCGIEGEGLDSSISINGYHDDSKDYIPATKEQRELLFQRMEEAGYEWDAKKKKLKKIKEEKASFANRQLYNRAILKLLSDYVEKYPDIRFGQMLCNLDIKPHFDEESRETYWNLSKTINKRKS